MSKGLIGKKIGMTQIFADDGRRIPVTVVAAGPCTITQLKDNAKDGYTSVQLAYESMESQRVSKSILNHCAAAAKGAFRYFREFRNIDIADKSIGDTLTAEIFTTGEFVDVHATSKGKGFQGVMKRWNFKGGKASHGSRFHRAPGSIGCSATPSRVFKNKKMPGQYGNATITVQRLQVIRIDAEANLILIKGAIPGPKNGIVTIKNTVKP